jgi:hypothetical protein
MAQTALMIGTRKGLWIATSDEDRRSWSMHGPDELRSEVHAVAVDTQGDKPRMFMASRHWHWGPQVLRSDDLGQTWDTGPEGAIRFPEETGRSLEAVWSIAPSTAEPGIVWAGTEPSALFRSTDGGNSFTMVRPLWDHPHREQWGAGAGGQAIHTILPHPRDPDRVLIALSSGGCYRTYDGGKSWAAANQGVKVTFLPDPPQFPEFGQCVHKVAQDCADPERLYLQNHNGVYRSDDWGGQWTSIADGLPGEFGFSVLADPHAAGGAYVIPLVSDGFRFAPDFRCRVYGTRDAGTSWSEIGDGLPGPGFYSLVLRDAFATDGGDPAGLYFGTRDGCLYAGGPDGWTEVANHLPDVLSVRAAVID